MTPDVITFLTASAFIKAVRIFINSASIYYQRENIFSIILRILTFVISFIRLPFPDRFIPISGVKLTDESKFIIRIEFNITGK